MDLLAVSQSIDQSYIDRRLVAEKGFYRFAQKAWPEVESDDLVWTWHMRQICDHLEAVSRGDCKRLIINVPPGCSKSTLVSVLWPAWDWIKNPTRKWMAATFDQNLAFRAADDCKRLVSSQWYQARWPHVRINESGDVQATKTVYSTIAGGRRVSVTVGGRATGWHANVQVIDDPIKPKDVSGDPELARDSLERTWRWWTATMASRRSDPKKFARVIIMQRLHEADLVGRILENDTEHEWTHLMLPMLFEPERACKTKFGGDVRTKAGELLCPERFDQESVHELQKELGSQVTAAQLQQRPAPATGALFKREWFKESWRELPADVFLAISVDATFKDSASSDFVAIHVWGQAKGKFYLVDRIHDRMGLPETIRCIETMRRRYPRCRTVLIEDKANGPAIEQTLRHTMTGIIMITPEGGKIARANAVSPFFEAGNVVFPDPSVKPWIDDVLEEMVTFPFSRHDDDVDACTQALTYLNDKSCGRYLEAMRAVASGKFRIAK